MQKNPPSNNTSGAVGVHLDRKKGPNGTYTYYWVAEWSPVPGERPARLRFSVSRYGEAQAKALAIEARHEGVKAAASRRQGVVLAAEPQAAHDRSERVHVDALVTRLLAQQLSVLAHRRGMSRGALAGDLVEAAVSAGLLQELAPGRSGGVETV